MNLDRMSMAYLLDKELMDKDEGENSRNLTVAQLRALAAKFARWSRQCRDTAKRMQTEPPCLRQCFPARAQWN